MMEKTTRDTKCSFELALNWALSVKNSLNNVGGFSPFQFVLWKKQKLISTLQENLNVIRTMAKSFASQVKS